MENAGRDDNIVSPQDWYGNVNKSEQQTTKSHTKICEPGSNRCTMRKPRLLPARSLEITECKPHGQHSHRFMDTIHMNERWGDLSKRGLAAPETWHCNRPYINLKTRDVPLLGTVIEQNGEGCLEDSLMPVGWPLHLDGAAHGQACRVIPGVAQARRKTLKVNFTMVASEQQEPCCIRHSLTVHGTAILAS